MLHVIWRRSVLSVSRTLSLVVQCGSFCGRWSKAVSQSRHPVACVCISLGHFKIGKNESTDRQRCHMMIACYIRFDLLHFILFLEKCAETCWRNLSSTWGPIHSLHGRGQKRSAGHGSSHGSLSVKLSIRLITSVSQCVKCLFHSVWAVFFADATHWPWGAIGCIYGVIQRRRTAYPPYSLSQSGWHPWRQEGWGFWRRFHKLHPRSLSPTFSQNYEMMQKDAKGQKANYSQKANRKHRKRCQSLDISQLLEDRHSARGPAEVLRWGTPEGVSTAAPGLHVDCTWKFPYTSISRLWYILKYWKMLLSV